MMTIVVTLILLSSSCLAFEFKGPSKLQADVSTNGGNPFLYPVWMFQGRNVLPYQYKEAVSSGLAKPVVVNANMANYMPYVPNVKDFPVAAAAATVQANDEIAKESRFQAMVVVEKYLETKNDASCLQRSLCDIAAGAFDGTPEEKAAMQATVDAMRNVVADLDPANRPAFPNVGMVVGSYAVGEKVAADGNNNNNNLCKMVYPCQGAATRAENPEGRNRVSCRTISDLCPAIAIGCGLCGVLAPAHCFSLCPMAAIYCGTSIYACSNIAAQAAAKTTTAATTTAAPTTTAAAGK